MQHQKQVPASPSDDGRAHSPSWTHTSNEPYYSNKDITVLYDIVVAAQTELDHAPQPRPLPAAALFKAYDTVLPKHGVDPDSDQHLSAFIFRVVGERGDDTLVAKFQAILGRMGIILEHSDNTTASIRNPESASLSPSQSPPQIIRPWDRRALVDNATPRDGPEFLGSLSASLNDDNGNDDDDEWEPIGDPLDAGPQNGDPGVSQKNVNGWEPHAPHLQENKGVSSLKDSGRLKGDVVPPVGLSSGQPQETSTHRGEDGGPQAAFGELRRRALISVLDRWRGIATAQPSGAHHHRENTLKPIEELPGSDGEDDTEGLAPAGKEPAKTVTVEGRVLPTGALNAQLKSFEAASEIPYEEAIDKATAALTLPQESAIFHTPPRANDADDESHNRLLNRAARARELYLGSKMFNKWADRTARRLEREAVARRHMIRFRCFRAWIQAPTSTSPEIDQLKSLTAVEKLRRAVAAQEEQFKKAAQALAISYRLGVVSRVFERWSCHLLGHRARQKNISQTRDRVLGNWQIQSSNNAGLHEAIVLDKARHSLMKGCFSWIRETKKHAFQSEAAGELQKERLAYSYLCEWWQQAEAKRRAEAWRHCILLERACKAFDQWNLRARAQAFTWRMEYVAVTRVFSTWITKSQEDGKHSDRARSLADNRLKSKYMEKLSLAHREHSDLTRLHSRANLYIKATKVLEVFDLVTKRRRERAKKDARRAVMKRYEEMSSDRKKRNFFNALDRWKSSTNEALDTAQMVDNHRELESIHQQKVALTAWRQTANEHKQRSDEAKRQHVRQWLIEWADITRQNEEQEQQAWEIWATGKQYQYVKDWSIASMQQGGQAHTAAVVRQKHDREKRNIMLRYWRQNSGLESLNGPEIASDNTPAPQSIAANRSTWKASSTQRSMARRIPYRPDDLASLVGTPTPWTGLHSYMGNRSQMDPLAEADEEAHTQPIPPGHGRIRSLQLGQGAGQLESQDYPTTTPRAPVPSHLKQVYESQSLTAPSRAHVVSLPPGVQLLAPRQSASDTQSRHRVYEAGGRDEASRHQSSLAPTPNPFRSQRAVNVVGASDMFAPIVKSRSVSARPSRLPQKVAGQPTSDAIESTELP